MSPIESIILFIFVIYTLETAREDGSIIEINSVRDTGSEYFFLRNLDSRSNFKVICFGYDLFYCSKFSLYFLDLRHLHMKSTKG